MTGAPQPTKHPGMECICERFVTCKECIELHRATTSDKVLDELRGHFVKLYDGGFKDPLVTFDASVSMMKYGDLKLRTKERERMRKEMTR
jgi:hypothetical protein